MDKPSDGKSTFIKVARALTYIVYTFTIIAIVFLVLGFFLLLFGANTDSSFVRFVYNIAAEFLQPFRGIFPVHQINDRSYFSAAGLFAIIMYGFFAMLLHALINYITLKQVNHQNELLEAQRHAAQLQAQQRAQASARTQTTVTKTRTTVSRPPTRPN